MSRMFNSLKDDTKLNEHTWIWASEIIANSMGFLFLSLLGFLRQLKEHTAATRNVVAFTLAAIEVQLSFSLSCVVTSS